MRGPRMIAVALTAACAIGLTAAGMGATMHARSSGPPVSQSDASLSRGPFVIMQMGDTTWIKPYADDSHCPGDPLQGHGGEATGGPDGSETWCFEGGPGDTCGTNPPWDTNCFDHINLKALPSPEGTNYWHLDQYRTDQQPYCGDYCLWCGTDSTWEGQPVECGTWANTPGYGNRWNCIVELDLDSAFTVAGGCTLYFDPRYDTECKYDYLYAEFWDGSGWQTLAMFNATSNNAGPECGGTGGGNPDYWGNTDTGQPLACDWQGRSVPGEPAFVAVIEEWGDSTFLDSVDCAPTFRWRFESDRWYSDQDGILDTDGGGFIDNVCVYGDPGCTYIEDFEHGEWDTLAARGWSRPDPEAGGDPWHIVHDPDPPYEGGDGQERTSCFLDSSYVYKFKPETGYNVPWYCDWHARLMSPKVPVENTGCVVQYDEYLRAVEYCCIWKDTKVRFYDADFGKWCPWTSIDGEVDINTAGQAAFNIEEDVTQLYDAGADSVQFGWDFEHCPDPMCCGKSLGKNDLHVDNVSIGFYDGTATRFSVRPVDLLMASFHDSLCGFNSFFDALDPDTIAYYSGPPYTPEIPRHKQLVVSAVDKDSLREVRLYGSIDVGATWAYRTMNLDDPIVPGVPELGGDYSATLCPTDFGQPRWPERCSTSYYVRSEDFLGNLDYFPSAADPGSPLHTGTPKDYFQFNILKPPGGKDYACPVVLLVDGHAAETYDWSPCLSDLGNQKSSGEIYEQILVDAGYCFDTYRINSAGSATQIPPVQFDGYDCVVWFTGHDLTQYLILKEAQVALTDYLDDGGKIVLCGDRLAFNMAPQDPCGGVGEDSLGGEFLEGVMGTDYCDCSAEMETPFDRPYVYLETVPTVTVFGTPVTVRTASMDSICVYRECPLLKDMSYVRAIADPPAGYAAQPLLEVLNPSARCDPAQGAIYVEKQAHGGQAVFVDYDMTAWINHSTGYCDGTTPATVPDFQPGEYAGRVELMRFILEGLFGIPSSGAGVGGKEHIRPRETLTWGLWQNSPNPLSAGTEIRFDVARTAHVSIKIYNAMGQLVAKPLSQRKAPGKYSAHWDGRNASGERVSSGVYFYRMEAGPFTATKKMLVVN
jgi:hypothetical protein